MDTEQHLVGERAEGEPEAEAGRLEFWRSVPIFRDLSAEVCARLSAASHRRRWAAGAILFHREDPSTYLVAVEKGRIRLSLQTASGREFALRQVGPGALFGEVGVLDGLPRSANAVAVIPSAGYIVERRDLLALMHRHPELAETFIRHLCSLLRYTTEHIETIALYGLEGRLARFLLSQLNPDAGEVAQRAELQLELSQSDIAELLGASRPKVNRAIVTLEKAGAIRRDGKTILCNRARLVRIADPEDE
jgi:CRP/FNR family cyclic AMP-dependent transcriptional regulator